VENERAENAFILVTPNFHTMATRKTAKRSAKKATARRRLAPKRAARVVRKAAKPRRIAQLKIRKIRTVKARAAKARVVKAVRAKAGSAPSRSPRKSLKLLENTHIRNLFVELAGEKSLKVAGELTEPMSDETLANTTKTKISEVRAVMNKLHSVGVAAYARTRNDEGWYTYTWRLCLDKAQRMIADRNTEKRTAGEVRKADVADYYVCPNCFTRSGRKFGFEKATDAEFRCPECSEMLKYVEKKD